ncbi:MULTISPECIES: arginase [Bacillus]|uniref:arginase n=1 Tax=Bacillus TaxID=1386 RepID=UPI00158368DA|nr:arginase [Bacillus glycinifermentans]MBU8785777.1 arginase [Bacillus glycinifermentans]NUJ15686.1 arginase [Bacillus glycinifermentans]
MLKKISMIGVPMDLGQLRRGVDMGPSAIRCAGVNERLESLSRDIEDLGDITIGQREDEREGGESASEELRNLKAITNASLKLAQTVDKIVASGSFPLVLGGDHSIAIGTLAGLARHYHHLGVIWYDAHADVNTKETSPSGNIHGMPLAISMGIGHERLTGIYGDGAKVKPENIVIIGARSLDDGEKKLIREQGIKVYTMHEIDRLGMTRVMEETIEYLRERTDGVHLSLDLDALDPNDAPGVGTPVAGGISYRESHLAMEMLEESNLVTSAEFVEVNPVLDEKNRTAETAVALMGSLFGEKLL